MAGWNRIVMAVGRTYSLMMMVLTFYSLFHPNIYKNIFWFLKEQFVEFSSNWSPTALLNHEVFLLIKKFQVQFEFLHLKVILEKQTLLYDYDDDYYYYYHYYLTT